MAHLFHGGARTVRRLVPPAQGRVEVFDARTPGLAVRVSVGGRKTWTAVWHRKWTGPPVRVGDVPGWAMQDFIAEALRECLRRRRRR